MAANVKIPDDAYSRNALWESQPRFQDLSSSAEKSSSNRSRKSSRPDNFQQVLIFPVRLKTRENVDSTLISLAITHFVGWNLT